MRVGELHENPANPREGHDVDGIAASMQRFGWGRPLLYRSATRELEAGHGSILAARKLGLQEVPAIALEHDAREAAGFAIADNRVRGGARTCSPRSSRAPTSRSGSRLASWPRTRPRS